VNVAGQALQALLVLQTTKPHSHVTSTACPGMLSCKAELLKHNFKMDSPFALQCHPMTLI